MKKESRDFLKNMKPMISPTRTGFIGSALVWTLKQNLKVPFAKLEFVHEQGSRNRTRRRAIAAGRLCGTGFMD
jgi:hypothetical protein